MSTDQLVFCHKTPVLLPYAAPLAIELQKEKGKEQHASATGTGNKELK